MTPITLYILHTIATAPGPMTVEGLMERLESALAARLLRVHLNELLQDRSISTTEDPATRRPIITGLTPSGARSLGAIVHPPATTRQRTPAAPAARPKAKRAAMPPGDLLDKMADYLNAVPSTPRQLASACAVSLEEAAAAVRLLHRRGRIRRHVDETQPSTGIARRWHNVSWIGHELAARRRMAQPEVEPIATQDPDRSVDAVIDIVRAMPNLHAIATHPSPCR